MVKLANSSEAIHAPENTTIPAFIGNKEEKEEYIKKKHFNQKECASDDKDHTARSKRGSLDQ